MHALKLCSAIASFALLFSSPGLAQDASVRVVHGIPGPDVGPGVDPALPVDVLVNDAVCLLSGFTFGSVAGPFTLPAGTYDVKVSLANTLDPCSNAAVIAAPVPVAAGENATIIAHLSATGSPTASKFVNDVTPSGSGFARVIAHHTAAAPAVDINVSSGFPSSTATIPNAANGAQAAAEFRAGAINVGISPAGMREVLFVRTARIRSDLTYVAYAVGSLANGTFDVIFVPIGGLSNLTIRN
jgi:hypothetical protein